MPRCCLPSQREVSGPWHAIWTACSGAHLRIGSACDMLSTLGGAELPSRPGRLAGSWPKVLSVLPILRSPWPSRFAASVAASCGWPRSSSALRNDHAALIVKRDCATLQQPADGALEGLLAEAEQRAQLIGVGAVTDARCAGAAEHGEHVLAVGGEFVVRVLAERHFLYDDA